MSAENRSSFYVSAKDPVASMVRELHSRAGVLRTLVTVNARTSEEFSAQSQILVKDHMSQINHLVKCINSAAETLSALNTSSSDSSSS